MKYLNLKMYFNYVLKLGLFASVISLYRGCFGSIPTHIGPQGKGHETFEFISEIKETSEINDL